ncbi:MAG: hypothetical protein IPM53_28840 [Anaerolineaceae bacterium]|nr:hypothetical protein [Anaerolineaceae bacterium]
MNRAIVPYTLLIRVLVITAVGWAAAITVSIMSSPAVMTVTEAAGSEQPAEPVAIGWFAYAGFYGTLLLLLWTALFVVAAWAAWTGRTAVLALIAIPALIFSWLTLFSIGGGYIPATLALLAALILSVLQKRRIA